MPSRHSDALVTTPPRRSWKTALCRFFARGACGRGAGCAFAHGTGELRSPPSGARRRRRAQLTGARLREVGPGARAGVEASDLQALWEQLARACEQVETIRSAAADGALGNDVNLAVQQLGALVDAIHAEALELYMRATAHESGAVGFGETISDCSTAIGEEDDGESAISVSSSVMRIL